MIGLNAFVLHSVPRIRSIICINVSIKTLVLISLPKFRTSDHRLVDFVVTMFIMRRDINAHGI